MSDVSNIKDKYGVIITVGSIVKIIDAIGIGKVIHIHDDGVIVEFGNGSKVKSSKLPNSVVVVSL